MANLNRIILVGRLTADPELRSTNEGIPLTKFTLAVDRIRGPEAPAQVDFIPIITWRRLAEISSQYLKKGRLVLIEGSIQIRTFQTSEGKKKWSTEVVARSMQMLGKETRPASGPQEIPVSMVNSFAGSENSLEEIPPQDPSIF